MLNLDQTPTKGNIIKVEGRAAGAVKLTVTGSGKWQGKTKEAQGGPPVEFLLEKGESYPPQ